LSKRDGDGAAFVLDLMTDGALATIFKGRVAQDLFLDEGLFVSRMEITMVEAAPIPADGRIRCFSRDREAFGFLSHFHPSPIDLDGEI
jgi:hypothetical protein